jgi:hypothetical protein
MVCRAVATPIVLIADTKIPVVAIDVRMIATSFPTKYISY